MNPLRGDLTRRQRRERAGNPYVKAPEASYFAFMKLVFDVEIARRNTFLNGLSKETVVGISLEICRESSSPTSAISCVNARNVATNNLAKSGNSLTCSTSGPKGS